MKFRLKITVCMLWLLALAFGIGGSLLITLGFSESLQREKAAALDSFKTLLSALRLAEDGSHMPDHSNLSAALSSLSSQGGGWSAIRLGEGENTLYEDNRIGADTSSPLPRRQGVCSAAVIRAADGGMHLQLSARLSAGEDELRFDLCRDISGVFLQRSQQLRIYRWVFLAVVIISGAVCYGLAYWLTRPLYSLSRASRRFAAGELSYRAAVSSDDELGALTRDFNAMAEKIEENIETIRDSAARQEAFMGNFAHEMKNPMTSIIGYAELIRSDTLDRQERMEAASYIFSEGRRLESLSLKLLELLVMKKKDIELKSASPAQIVGGMVGHLKRVYEEKGIVLRCRCQEGSCLLEPELVRSLLVNLLDNARKAIDGGGNIYVLSQMTEDGCLIRVLDTGRGMAQEELQKITQAFYRVDKSRSRAQGGVGLGLALCSEIAQLHKGSISFESREGNGTCVSVRLRGGRI